MKLLSLGYDIIKVLCTEEIPCKNKQLLSQCAVKLKT